MKTVYLEVEDDFEIGDCYNCPLSYDNYYDEDGYSEVDTYCVLHCSYENCPLKIREEE